LESKLIHKDSRGTITCFYIDGVEYTILQTRKGFARGGCIHNVVEHAAVLQGEVEYHIRGNAAFKVQKGDNVHVQSETPHYFVSLTDSIVLEWNAPPDQKKRKDTEWRSMVEKINEEREKQQ